MTEIGFIGLGVMGGPMACNLIDAGHTVVAYSRTRASVDAIVEHGAIRGASAADAAGHSDVVITMLPDSPDVLSVMDQVVPAARAGQLLIDMSTISPGAAREVAQRVQSRGLAFLDAPVSGGDVGARDGTLSIMVGGDRAAYDQALPIFEVLGSTVTHVGAHGAGQVVKACNQVVVALTIQAVSEALVLGASAGIDPACVLDVLSGGLAANRVMEMRRSNFLKHDFSPGFRIDLHHKDLGIALAAARGSDVVLPMTALAEQLMTSLRAQGHGSEDHSALLRVIEQLSQRSIDPHPETDRS